MHWLITILSLGILWPRMTFALEKYRTDRTWFGSAQLHQGGRWPMLYRAAIPVIGAVVLLVLLALWMMIIVPVFPGSPFSFEPLDSIIENLFGISEEKVEIVQPWRLALIPGVLTLLLFGVIHYRFVSKRIMANHKSANGIALASKLSGPRVTMIYILGNTIAYFALVFGIIFLVFFGAVAFGFERMLEDELTGNSVLTGLPQWVSLVAFGVLYLGLFLLWGVLYNAFVTFPLMRHMAQTTSLPNAAGLETISQRARDEFAEAEGFAEALDLGAAI